MQSLLVDEEGINNYFKTLDDHQNKLDFESFKKIIGL